MVEKLLPVADPNAFSIASLQTTHGGQQHHRVQADAEDAATERSFPSTRQGETLPQLLPEARLEVVDGRGGLTNQLPLGLLNVLVHQRHVRVQHLESTVQRQP